MSDDVVWIEVQGKRIGSWKIPDETLSNFQDQQDLGWHIFLDLQRGETEIKVCRGREMPWT